MAKTDKGARADKGESEVATSKMEIPIQMVANILEEKHTRAGNKPDTVTTIKRGDTLSSLARKYGTTVKALMAANPDIKNANKIFAGKKLNIKNMSVPQATEDDPKPTRKPAVPPKMEDFMKKDIESQYAKDSINKPTRKPKPSSSSSDDGNDVEYKHGGSLTKRSSSGRVGVGAAQRGYGAVRSK